MEDSLFLTRMVLNLPSVPRNVLLDLSVPPKKAQLLDHMKRGQRLACIRLKLGSLILPYHLPLLLVHGGILIGMWIFEMLSARRKLVIIPEGLR